MTSAELRAQFPYTWAYREPVGYQHQLCRPGEPISKGRAIIHFFDGYSYPGNLRGCRPIDAPPRGQRDRGKTEAELAKEIRDHIHLRGFRTHRIQADQCEAFHQKAHEREEAGTPDYICHGTRSLVSTAWGLKAKAHFEECLRAYAVTGERVVRTQQGDSLLAAHFPVLFYWEAKRQKGGKIRPTQRVWIDDARRRGFAVLEAPRSIEDVDKWLEEQGWLKR